MNKQSQTEKPKNMLSKQKLIIIILGVCAVILAGVYIAMSLLNGEKTVTLPLYDEDGDRLEYTYSAKSGNRVTVLENDGENLVLSADSDITYESRPFIFPEIAPDDLESVNVANTSGSYTLEKDSAAGEFVFKGDEMLVYNAEPLANLKFQARYMLSLQKVEGRYETDSALEPFGLDAAASPVTVTVTNSNGAAHTVLFGDKLVTGAAYYAKDAAKPFVYVVDSSVSVFFEDEKSFFDPKIAPTLTQSEYQYMESFAIRKNGEPFLASAIVPEEQRTDTGDTDLHKITYPAGYSASLSKYYEALASLATLSGSKVIETNVFASGEENTAALFDKYGLTVATNDVSYAVGEKSYRFLTGTRFTDSDGAVCYYAYSPYMDDIVILPLENAPFLEYELLDFIDGGIFQINIKDITELTASVPGITCHFTLEGEGQELKVTETTSGKVIDTPSFRQFYISLLSTRIEGYATSADVTGNTEFSFSVTTKYGETASYSFDIISTTRDLITLDGAAEFYANRSYITKAAERLLKLAAGETIQADY